LPPGSVERIAHYRILKRIGRGGMGVVYRAEDERDGRLVALKVIRETESPGVEDAAHALEARVRFDREAGILRSLLHVNVVSFYEIGEEDGTPYLAMEYLDGVPLTSLAGRPWSETVPLLVQAAHGLEYLSSRGIVHRDLSPDNILVIERGGERLVKLLDFGVAKLFERGPGFESLTATGFFLGKVAYGSPEQLGSLGPHAVLDWRSDAYSLGVIFYQVLSGRRPFEGKVPVEYIAGHLNTAPAPVAAPTGSPALPMGLVRLIAQMLEKRREDRPATWREIVDRLVAVLRETGISARTPSEPLPMPSPANIPTRKTSLVASGDPSTKVGIVPPPQARRGFQRAATAAGVLAVAALAFWIVRSASRPTASPAPPRATAARLPKANLNAGQVAPAAAPGRIQLLATPWARVVSISDIATDRRLSLPEGTVTPCLVTPVEPGTYRVVLLCPQAGQKQTERLVTVTPGETVLVSEPFSAATALAGTLR
jgi:serine/threonine protein kinase